MARRDALPVIVYRIQNEATARGRAVKTRLSRFDNIRRSDEMPVNRASRLPLLDLQFNPAQKQRG